MSQVRVYEGIPLRVLQPYAVEDVTCSRMNDMGIFTSYLPLLRMAMPLIVTVAIEG